MESGVALLWQTAANKMTFGREKGDKFKRGRPYYTEEAGPLPYRDMAGDDVAQCN